MVKKELSETVIKRYNIVNYRYIGEGVKMEYYYCYSKYNGEERILLLQKSKTIDYVTAIFSIPKELEEGLLAAIIKIRVGIPDDF